MQIDIASPSRQRMERISNLIHAFRSAKMHIDLGTVIEFERRLMRHAATIVVTGPEGATRSALAISIREAIVPLGFKIAVPPAGVKISEHILKPDIILIEEKSI